MGVNYEEMIFDQRLNIISLAFFPFGEYRI